SNRMLGVTTSAQAKSTEKLSSGYKINRAADDAAGLSISEKMRSQIRGLTQASSNAQDGISCVQTAEGALTEVHSMLQRMNELSVKASTGTLSENDRTNVQDEVDQLLTEIDRVSETTKFNETYLLKGNGQTATKTINAHDAGIVGKLTDNGNGTSTFALDKTLKDGDSIKIAGKEYTIYEPKSTGSYLTTADADNTVLSLGDKYTQADGTVTTVVKKMTETAAEGLSWAVGDSFTDSAGNTWNVVDDSGTTGTTGGDVILSDIVAKLDAGSTINSYAADATGAHNGMSVNTLGAGEVSSVAADLTVGTIITGGSTAGDTITKANGKLITVADNAPKAFSNLKEDILKLAAGDTVTIGGVGYHVAAESTSDTDLTREDIIAKINEGDTVTVPSGTFTAAGVTAAPEGTITADSAYRMIKEELTKASSIGTETGATVVDNNDATFTITQGTTTIKQALSVGLHVGADADGTNKITMDIDAMDTAGLGIKGLKVGNDETGTNATYAIDAINDAIKSVSAQRSGLGAVQNRLEHTIANLDNVVENTTSAESSIRDTDMASEMVAYSKNNILSQAGQSMLAQANQSTQGVLSLLQ
ncbi:MAG: flagellin, partial [Lachnospiraceae bacterium]|nr:flagellin [Lachnospiraceae bacterium]